MRLTLKTLRQHQYDFVWPSSPLFDKMLYLVESQPLPITVLINYLNLEVALWDGKLICGHPSLQIPAIALL